MPSYDVGRIEDFEGPFLNGRAVSFKNLADELLEPVYRMKQREFREKERQYGRPSSPYDHGTYDTGPDRFEKKRLNEFERKLEDTEAKLDIKDGSGWRTFEVYPREDINAYSPSTPFSIFVLKDERSDARIGWRIARDYDPELLVYHEMISQHGLMDDLDRDSLDNQAYWVPETDLVAAATRPGGIDETILKDIEEMDPLMRSGVRVTQIDDSPELGFSDRDLHYLYSWGMEPYSGGVSSRELDEWARREATDRALGLVKNLDRDSDEFFLDAWPEKGRENFVFGDYEYSLLGGENLMERDRDNAIEVVYKGLRDLANSKSSRGSVGKEEHERIKEKKEEFVNRLNRHEDNMGDHEELLLDNLPETYDIDLFPDDRVLGPEWN